MALLFIEGFEGWGTTNGAAPDDSMQRRWTVLTADLGVMDIEAGRIAGHCIQFDATDDQCTSPDLGANTTLYSGFGFKYGGATDTRIIFSYMEPGSTLGMNIRLTSAGELAVYRGSSLIATTSSLGLIAATWYYIEFKVYIHASTGAYDLRVGETSVLSNGSLDTLAGATAELRQIRLTGSVSDPYFDDIYVNDSGFYGNVRVDAVFPDAAGDTTNWAPSAGSNYDCMNENPPNDDTDYVEDSVSAERDLYNYGSLPSGIGDIKGIQIATECRETDATTYSLKTVIKSNTTVSADAGQVIGSTSYIEKRHISVTDPDTATAWTVSGVNAAQFGIEVS